MDEKDLLIENLVDKPTKKKKVDGKAKGDRTELHLCKLLTDHFGEEFSRALGSGSRWSQVGNLPEHAKKTLTGDICVPEKFKWVIECKGGYEGDLDLNNVCDGALRRLDEFIEQSSRDAAYSGRKPVVLWKRNRKPWLAVISHGDIAAHENRYNYIIHYRDWRIVNFEELLRYTNRKFWFEE